MLKSCCCAVCLLVGFSGAHGETEGLQADILG